MFPKSLDVGKAIDKAAGAPREVVGTRTDGRYVSGFSDKAKRAQGAAAHDYSAGWVGDPAEITAPATEAARQWSEWGTAIKPAHEPIILARKPLSEGAVAANVLRWGTGALNVDGCKVGTGDALVRPSIKRDDNEVYGKGLGAGVQDEPAGRWPPNLLLTHSADCRETGEVVMVKPNGGRGPRPQPEQQDKAVYGHGLNQQRGAGSPDPEPVMVRSCAPGCPVAGLDAQSGVLHSQDPRTRRSSKVTGGQMFDLPGMSPCYGDKGGASRFFPAFTWSPEYDLPFMYQAKAPKRERPRIKRTALRLRADLSADERAYVLAELRKAGVDAD